MEPTPLEHWDHIDPALMPELDDRLFFLYRIILREREEELFAAADADEANEDEEGTRVGEFLDAMFGRYETSAELAAFELIPDDNEDVEMIRFRLMVLATAARSEAEAVIENSSGSSKEEAEALETFRGWHDRLLEHAETFLGKAGTDFDAGMEWIDGTLTELEDLWIADYFPDYLADLQKQSREWRESRDSKA